MRVQCERCQRYVEVDRLSAVEGGLGFACPACGAANRVAGPSEPPVPPPAPPPASPAPPRPSAGDAVVPRVQVCPKCGHVQTDEYACHRCGLVFARAAGDVSALDPLAGHPAAESIRARWAELRDRLDDVEGHHAFIRMCVEQDLLEYAGLCYRRLTPPGALEDERVAAYRERVVKAALARIAQIEGRRTDRLSGRLRGLLVLTFVAFLFLAFAVGYFLLARAQAPTTF